MTSKNPLHIPVVSPIAYTVAVEPCHEAVDEHHAAEVLAALAAGNIWAWCNVRVTATVTVTYTKPRIDTAHFGLDADPERPSFQRFEGSDVCVGYRGSSEESFKRDSPVLFREMQHLAVTRLSAQLRETITRGAHAAYALRTMPDNQTRYMAAMPMVTAISNIDEVLELVTELSTRLAAAHQLIASVAEVTSKRVRDTLTDVQGTDQTMEDLHTAAVDLLHVEALALDEQYSRERTKQPLRAYPEMGVRLEF